MLSLSIEFVSHLEQVCMNCKNMNYFSIYGYIVYLLIASSLGIFFIFISYNIIITGLLLVVT